MDSFILHLIRHFKIRCQKIISWLDHHPDDLRRERFRGQLEAYKKVIDELDSLF